MAKSKGKNKQKYALIIQALSAAESSINLAKQLLADVAGERVLQTSTPQITAKDLPGVTGKFDGIFMVDENNRKYEVPENYASKSLLVYGDTLKLVDEDGRKKFKQVERVKRQRAEGILAQKDGKFCVVTADGSYKVLEASVKFFNLKAGDQVIIVLPLANKHVPFAAIERRVEEKAGSQTESKADEKTKELKKVEAKKKAEIEARAKQAIMVKKTELDKKTAKKKPAAEKAGAKKSGRIVKREAKKEAPKPSTLKSTKIPEEDELR